MGITQAAMQAKGGPSVSWMTKLPHREGPPTPRQALMLDQLDVGLNWPHGTSRAFISEDRDGWTEEQWREEMDRLTHLQDKYSNAGWLVEQRLRSMRPAEADEMIRSIFRVMGMPVRE